MKTTVALSLWLALGGICRAEQVLAEYDWQKLADGGHLRAGIPVMMEGRAAVKISNTNDTPLQAQLLAITNPPITKTLYAIVGEVRYEGVQGDGYLEMWNAIRSFPQFVMGGAPYVWTTEGPEPTDKIWGLTDHNSAPVDGTFGLLSSAWLSEPLQQR